MKDNFKALNANEYRSLKDAMALIAILIAGADGIIDAEEKEWAVKVTNIRTYSGPEVLHPYYKDVGQDYQSKLDNLIKALPNDVDERNHILSEKIASLNPILAKLDQGLGATFYDSFTSFAVHVAKASGGFMRMWSISKAEAKWVKLPMLNAIEHPIIEEESE